MKYYSTNPIRSIQAAAMVITTHEEFGGQSIISLRREMAPILNQKGNCLSYKTFETQTFLKHSHCSCGDPGTSPESEARHD